MAYTTIDDPEAHFQVNIYTGDGNDNRDLVLPGDTDMQPDMIWTKNRDTSDPNTIVDAVRGGGETLYPNSSATEDTHGLGLTAFNSDGYRVRTGANWNTDTEKYVGWCWKAGGSTSSNTTGGTSSTVSLNSTAKFSIVQWTGTGSTTTVGHSLGVVPHVLITKSIGSGNNSWGVYHHRAASAISSGQVVKGSPEDGSMQLDGNSAWYDHTAYHNDTAPTSTVFTVNSDTSVNHTSNTMMGYCFSEVQGFSKFGFLNGNGDNDGIFLHCGFAPTWFMSKRTDASASWNIWNRKSNPYNPADALSYADGTDAEASSASYSIDFLSNGIKMRGYRADTNTNNATHIWIAFAEAPFVNSNGVPCNAR